MKTSLLALFLLTITTSLWSQYIEYGLPENDQTGQKIIRTQDGGFFIVASKSCYTPGYIYFHGCPRGTYLIRLDEHGDTLWTNQINKNGYHNAHLFENADGTFTIISRDFNNFSCGYLGIAGLGLLQLITMHISATGELLSSSSYPQDCELSLRSVLRLSDNRFAILTTYNDINYWNWYENRLYIMDKDLIILDSTDVYFGDLNFTQLVLNKNNEILLLHSTADSILRMNVYDFKLNLIRSHANADLLQSCFTGEFWNHEIIELDNGNLVAMCSDWVQGEYGVELALLNDQLGLLAHHNLNLIDATDMVVVNQGRVAIVSQNIDLPEDEDIQLTYYTPSGDSLETTIIRKVGVQRPTDMVLLHNNKIAVTGHVNCCSYPDSIGPSNTFIYLGELSTALDPIETNDESFILPNPAGDFVNIVLNEDGIKNKNNLNLSFHSISGSHILKSLLMMLLNRFQLDN